MRAKPESLQGDRQVTINSLFGRAEGKSISHKNLFNGGI